MPFTVSCPACSSRFALGDDLFRRKVAGNLVTVRCRNCSAEIAVDATEPPTLPSHEAPRRGPSPPRPKGTSTQLGLGVPAPPLAPSATTTPLGLGVSPSLPQSPTAPPLKPLGLGAPLKSSGAGAPPKPVGRNATVTPLPAGEALSIWNTDETVAINAPVAPAAAPAAPAVLPPSPKPPKAVPKPPLKAARPKEPEPEFIEAEEIPISSSGAPTLDALTTEAGRPQPAPAKPAADDFLINLSAGNQGILGAPTIDVSGLNAPNPPSVDVDVDVDLNEEEELEYRPAVRTVRSGTVPLFDMSAVLPAAQDAAKLGSASAAPATLDLAKGEPAPPVSHGKARERKFVIMPHEAVVAPKTRRGGAGLWFGLVAVAAGIVAVVGLRGHQPAQHAAAEPAALVDAPAAPLPTAPAAISTPTPATPENAPSETPSAAPLASAAPTTASVVSTATAALTNAPSNGKSRENVKVEAAAKPAASPEAALAKPALEKPPVVAEPAVEKPVLEKPAAPNKPIEVHNAPPPAEPGTEFDRAAARAALAGAAAQASACRKDGDPTGTASITITFAPSGRVTSANLQGPPFAGTPTGGCIANAMRHAKVPAFSGEHVTVTKTIVIQ